jgi:hypothetical protein
MSSVQELTEYISILPLPFEVAEEVVSFFKPVRICEHEPDVKSRLEALKVVDLNSNFARLRLLEKWNSRHPFTILHDPDLSDDIRRDVIMCQMNKIAYLPRLRDVCMSRGQRKNAISSVCHRLSPSDWALKIDLFNMVLSDVDEWIKFLTSNDIKKDFFPWVLDVAYGSCRSEVDVERLFFFLF